MKCPKCHADNPETKQFCGDCGTQLPTPPPQGHPLVVTDPLQAPVHELTPGSTFAGRYQINEELGKGGTGVVYKARDIHLDRFAAVKVLDFGLAKLTEILPASLMSRTPGRDGGAEGQLTTHCRRRPARHIACPLTSQCHGIILLLTNKEGQ